MRPHHNMQPTTAHHTITHLHKPHTRTHTHARARTRTDKKVGSAHLGEAPVDRILDVLNAAIEVILAVR